MMVADVLILVGTGRDLSLCIKTHVLCVFFDYTALRIILRIESEAVKTTITAAITNCIDTPYTTQTCISGINSRLAP